MTGRERPSLPQLLSLFSICDDLFHDRFELDFGVLFPDRDLVRVDSVSADGLLDVGGRGGCSSAIWPVLQ